jgi:allophanate hydrolase
MSENRETIAQSRETIAELVAAHRADSATIATTLQRTYARLAAANDPAIFISHLTETEALAAASQVASQMSSRSSSLPLYGIPVAVKDNIDVAGVPTTAGCPAFAYVPQRDATVVARLKQAGAIIIGKTNLDQFATGLVGVRSPYGVPRNAMRGDLIPGGSSSGSAVAVARGIVPLALGTDTAGSGRIPAGLNNIVGLKPSLGLLSAAGVVPACRSLDCVSLFALTAADALTALQALAGPDPTDSYTRDMRVGMLGLLPPHLRVGVPRAEDLQFFGDATASASFAHAIDIIRRMGCHVVEVDFTPFLATARLLYDGAWVSERTVAVGDFIDANPDKVHPVTRAIIASGRKHSAVDAFRAAYRLRDLSAVARGSMKAVDALMVPTAPTTYTISDLEADPIELNSRLGTYTNFVNLLDLAGISVPCTVAVDGTSHGVTFLGPAGHDSDLASLGAAFHSRTHLPLGALQSGSETAPPLASAVRTGEVEIAVVGAHLSGMPLNHELTSLHARFLRATTTTADYRLFALPHATPPKPGLLRVTAGTGRAIAVETWALSFEGFGRFVQGVPAPLSIGTLRLSDGRSVKGFLVEPEGVVGARDVSEFGGWRAAVAALLASG